MHEVTLPKAPPGALRHVALYRAGARDKGVFVLHTPATNTSLLVLVAPGALTANGRVRRSAAEVSAGAAATFFKRARDGETD